MIEFSFDGSSSLPHRVVVNGQLHGAGQTKSDAVVAALSAGGYVPAEIRHDKREIARHLFWNYEATPPWAELIGILDRGD